MSNDERFFEHKTLYMSATADGDRRPAVKCQPVIYIIILNHPTLLPQVSIVTPLT